MPSYLLRCLRLGFFLSNRVRAAGLNVLLEETVERRVMAYILAILDRAVEHMQHGVDIFHRLVLDIRMTLIRFVAALT